MTHAVMVVRRYIHKMGQTETLNGANPQSFLISAILNHSISEFISCQNHENGKFGKNIIDSLIVYEALVYISLYVILFFISTFIELFYET